MTLTDDQQSSSPGSLVQLFQLDMTVIMDLSGNPGSVIYFTPVVDAAMTSVFFDSVEYLPLPVKVDGYEITGKGQIPRPTMTVSNVLGVLSSLLLQFGSINGSILTRIRTFSKYLDGEAEADPTAYFPVDVFSVERKVTHTKVAVEWALRASMDQEGVMLPARQILRDTCTHIYRVHDTDLPDSEPYPGGPYDYTNATCPYNDEYLFLPTGAVTTVPSKDLCGKRLSDCQSRFNAVVDTPLPYRGFPGVARLRLPR